MCGREPARHIQVSHTAVKHGIQLSDRHAPTTIATTGIRQWGADTMTETSEARATGGHDTAGPTVKTSEASRAFWLTRGVIAVAFAILIGSVGVWLEDKGFALVDTFDKHVGDLPIAYGSAIASGQRDDIAVVLITEDTLASYDARSPIDRRLIGELVRAIDSAGPKAIGVNFILDRATPHDADFIKALREVKAPVVMTAIDEERSTGLLEESFRIQDDLLRAIGRPYGHGYFGRKKGVGLTLDGVVRTIAGESPKAPVPAFADRLAKEAGFDHRPKTRNVAWLRQLDSRTPVFAPLIVPAHPPSRSKEALAQFMNSARDSLRGRVVLIGASLADTLLAPSPLIEWTYSAELTEYVRKKFEFLDKIEISIPRPVLMAGTFIHAQAVAQRIDRTRDIKVLADWQSIALVTLAALACFSLARARHVSPQGLLYNFIGLVVVCVMCLLAYKYLLLELPSIALATAWALGGASGSIAGVIYNRLGIHN